MRLLADESVDAPIVSYLRDQGHDVVAIAETSPSQPDAGVLGKSQLTERVLITFDLDFGEHVYRLGREAAGIVLIRIKANGPQELYARFAEAWPVAAPMANGRFLVLKNNRIRVRPLPCQARNDGQNLNG